MRNAAYCGARRLCREGALGLLRNLQTRWGKVSYLSDSYRDPELDSFEMVDPGDPSEDYWQSLRELAVHELQTQSNAPRKRGRPALLQTYKLYKKDFLQRWSRFVTERAAQDNIIKDQLWMDLGFTWDVELRELRRGDARKSRVTYDRYTEVLQPLVASKGWNIIRRDRMTTIFCARLYNQEQFVEWVSQSTSATISPHLKLVSNA